MTPAEIAADLCRQRGGNFREEVEAHLLNGYVFSTPEFFLMGRAIPRSGDTSDLWHAYDPEECDAWYVWLGVGDASRLLAAMPYDLPWVGWHRQGREWREDHWKPVGALRKRLARV